MVDAAARYTVLYDDQCEICQAGVAWLRLLDRRRRVECLPVDPDRLHRVSPRLDLERCLRHLHVVAADGRVLTGWDAVAALARLFPPTWIIGALGGVPPFLWVGRAIYGYVAANRYSLSKCRGGACRTARLGEVRRRSGLGAFWTCRTLGMLLRLPLSLAAFVREQGAHLVVLGRTYRRRLDLPERRLSIHFLNGFPSDVIPVLFGELFTMVLYDGVAVDPGAPRMRRALDRHLRRLPPGAIRAVVATHHHEEHVGNLNWLAERTGAPVWVTAPTARLLQPVGKIPWARAAIIGQPPSLRDPFRLLGDRLETATGYLEVLPAPGHCDDQVVLYDPARKVLLAGDAFMGTYFSTPNPDVDSQVWMETLRRLADLDIDILVEGHGHVHTVRADMPDIPGVVHRQSPRDALRAKLDFLTWLRGQVEAGSQEGLPIAAIEATCFPWRAAWTWERFVNDEIVRAVSLGHFSRTELVRSFVRPPDGRQVLPLVYQALLYGSERLTDRAPSP
jgi:glyoxylase-like metal-dependent hydrolase (beta-lactamase superfamily II)/predicted DCC family thiol-disulfide oxidoreductase YuxK